MDEELKRARVSVYACVRVCVMMMRLQITTMMYGVECAVLVSQ